MNLLSLPTALEKLVLFGFDNVSPPLCHPIKPVLIFSTPSFVNLFKMFLTSSAVVTVTCCVENTPFFESDIKKSTLIGRFEPSVVLSFNVPLSIKCCLYA